MGGLGIVLDGVVLVFLGITIFYAARLSIYLQSFRASRKAMDKLINKLSKDIVQAEGLVQKMRLSAQETGGQLQDLVNEAKFLSDELRFMNEAGNNLADKLEKLAEKSSASTPKPRFEIPLESEQDLIEEEIDYAFFEEEEPEPEIFAEEEELLDDGVPFMIRDPEFEDDEPQKPAAKKGNVRSMTRRSQAEQDLREALEQTNARIRKSKIGGMA